MVSGRVSPEAGKGLVASSLVASVLFLLASSGDAVDEVLLMGVSLDRGRDMPGKDFWWLKRVRRRGCDQPAFVGVAVADCLVGAWEGVGVVVPEGAELALGCAAPCPDRVFCTQVS